MKAYIAALIAVVAFSGCSQNNGAPSGYLAAGVRLYTPAQADINSADTTAGQLFKNNRISKTDATLALGALRLSFRLSYVGYDLKKKLIGKSGDEIFADCERSFAEAPAELSTFEYYDLVSACLARFKDSHIDLSYKVEAPKITTAISEARLLDGKLLISRIRPNLIKTFEELAKVPPGTFADKMKIGYEISLINGKDPMLSVAALEPFITASTDAARTSWAVNKLFTRVFSYPKEKELTLTILQPDGTSFEATLPWIQHATGSSSLEARALLQEVGIIKASALSDAKNIMTFEGADNTLTLFKDLSNRKTYYNRNEEAAVTGIATIAGRKICYLQLNTFNVDQDDALGYKVTEQIGDTDNGRSLLDVLSEQLGSCESFGAPLIFDLRNNGGGSLELMSRIHALFETEGSTPLYSANSALFQQGNISYLNARLDGLDQEKSGLLTQLIFKSLGNKGTSQWVLSRNLNYNRHVFSGKVYLLVSKECISACEAISQRFLISKRATLIGEPTNGTGFGFSSFGEAQTKFRDPLNLYEVDIPNQAFQSILVADDSSFTELDKVKGSVIDFEKIQPMENNPVQVDYKIEYTLSDLTSDYPDYLRKLDQFIRDDVNQK